MTTWVSRHQKGKPFWILLKQEMTGGSGISWTICKSFAPHKRQDNAMQDLRSEHSLRKQRALFASFCRDNRLGIYSDLIAM